MGRKAAEIDKGVSHDTLSYFQLGGNTIDEFAETVTFIAEYIQVICGSDTASDVLESLSVELETEAVVDQKNITCELG